MIINDDKKKVLGSILFHTDTDGGLKETKEEEGEPLHAIALELIEAFEMKDPAALTDALRAFISGCEMSDEAY